MRHGCIPLLPALRALRVGTCGSAVAGCLLWMALSLSSQTLAVAAEGPDERPNILWVVCEDINPHLRCYGDRYADTPSLDRLAAKGLMYLNCWCNAPVCAPARTAIITGVYPPSTGSEHMRSMTRLPPGMRMFPQLLREAGYYCTNNAKEDYNLEKPGQVWDMSSRKAHWRNRRPGQPFFAVFNLEKTHESQIRQRPHRWVHDPAKAPLPKYHPDTPEVRQDWAQYYDNITDMDASAAKLLGEIEEAGLAAQTIVFFYGDNGGGMPRSKRCACDSGLHVPLLIHVPERFRHLAPKDYQPGTKTGRLVSFVDLGPTVLSLASVKPPESMQGHAFMGRYEAPPQPYLYGFRGRMDERYDMQRTLGDGRYVYVRNYMPHLPLGQHVQYMFETPTTRVWKDLFDAGKLTAEQSYFWRPKPPEELYDLQSDPDEVHNLAGSPAHQELLGRMRKAQHDWALKIRDVGFLPEPEIHSRAGHGSPYEVGHDEQKYPLSRILATAELASSLEPEALPKLKAALLDADSAVRYWAVMGLLIRGREAVQAARPELRAGLADAAPSVRVVAAQCLVQYGEPLDLQQSLTLLVELADFEKSGIYVSLMALTALDALGSKVTPVVEAIRTLPRAEKQANRAAMGISRLIQHIRSGAGR